MQAQRRKSQVAITAVDLVMEVEVPGLPPQHLGVQLRPGAPHSLHLQPGHPWTEVPFSIP